MTRRRWIAELWDTPLSTSATATLKGDQAAHLARVLRAQPGMEFDVVTGERVWHAAIETVSEATVTFRLIEELEVSSTIAITVLLSIFKFDRLEWAVEKLTELGVSTIQPVVARRTEKHLGQAAMNRVERWRRIALEAAKQSRRSSIPVIADPRPVKDCLGSFNGKTLRLVLAENETQKTLLRFLESVSSSAENQPVVLAAGPEGGWTPEEETMFAKQGWTPVSLGPTILRAETAAIAAVAMTAAWLNG